MSNEPMRQTYDVYACSTNAFFYYGPFSNMYSRFRFLFFKQYTSKLSAALGPFSAVIALFAAALPPQDSRELKYMKDAFDQTFHRLDTMERKVQYAGTKFGTT